MSTRRFRPDLLLLFALGVAVIWIVPRPPMVDLPQHAAQVALLKDLILHRSPWASELRINLFTPYLIGYGLAFPLALIMPVAAAIKCVLTLAFAAFVGLCLAIRREFGAPPRLDAYYFVSFFGFAYGWGLYTFLVAAPVGLAFIWLSIRYARAGGVGRAWTLAGLGVAMIFTHGLVCLFASGVGLVMLLVRRRNPLRLALDSWPFVAPILMCAVFLMITREPGHGALPDIAMGPLAGRLEFNLAGGFEGFVALWAMVASVVFATLPFAGGLRVDLRRRESLVIAGVLLAILLLAPVNVDWVGALYPRFTLFLPPAYAWLFREGPAPDDKIGRWIAPNTTALASVIAAVALAWHVAQAFAFSNESRQFDALLARAAPGQRALAVMLDQTSKANVNPSVYMHFPQWYGVEKHGFVDFTFAVYHPQIARLSIPPSPVDADDSFQWSPRFDWRRDDAGRYRYIFVRSAKPLPATLFAGAPCRPLAIAVSGPWMLFERNDCAARGAPHPTSQ